MLQLNHLKKYYGTQKAVDDISLRIPESGIFGLLGPNGAGKSSLLRMITGITIPDEGEILWQGKPLSLNTYRQWMGYMPEERGLYKKMKVGEQAMYLARLKGMSIAEAKRNIDFWFNRLDMQSWRNKKVEDLSKGMSQKLQFVTTVLHQPKILILDEPFSGLDPVNSQVIKDEIYRLAAEGTTIIFSTHRMEQVEEICNSIALINKGHLVIEGVVNEIKLRFDENKYLLEIEGDAGIIEPWVAERRQDAYILKCRDIQEAHQILQTCLHHQIAIKRFQHLLPSLNEIFIRLVETEGASTTFTE